MACRRLWEEGLSPEAFLANSTVTWRLWIFRAGIDNDFHPNTRTLCVFASPLRKAGETVRPASRRWGGMLTARAEGGPVDRE